MVRLGKVKLGIFRKQFFLGYFSIIFTQNVLWLIILTKVPLKFIN